MWQRLVFLGLILIGGLMKKFNNIPILTKVLEIDSPELYGGENLKKK